MEVMGRDTGWIAAAASILEKVLPAVNALVYVPEKAFDFRPFLADVSDALTKKDKLLIVVSEGLKDGDGNYMGLFQNGAGTDSFGHRQLGGSRQAAAKISERKHAGRGKAD